MWAFEVEGPNKSTEKFMMTWTAVEVMKWRSWILIMGCPWFRAVKHQIITFLTGLKTGLHNLYIVCIIAKICYIIIIIIIIIIACRKFSPFLQKTESGHRMLVNCMQGWNQIGFQVFPKFNSIIGLFERIR